MKNTLEMKTSSGFEVKIKKNRFENIELIDVLGEVMETGVGVGKLCTLLFGNEGKKAFYEHMRDKDGIVPVKKTMEEINEIFLANEETKN